MNKKIIYLIFVVVLFTISSMVVKAETAVLSGAEYLFSMIYDKYDGVNHIKNYARVIRNMDTGDVVYCIEPFSIIVDGTVYTVYDDLTDIFPISNEVFDKIKAYAYYGYGYENHDSFDWINITQMVIWRTIDPNSSFNWIRSLNSDEIVDTYDLKVKELEKLVRFHYFEPIMENDVDMSIDDEITIIDKNFVLNKYEVYDDDGLDVSISENKLTIKSNVQGTYNIRLRKIIDKVGTNVKLYYAPGNQSIIGRGDLDDIFYDIKVTVNSGSLKITKIDEDNGNTTSVGDAKLKGSIFDIYNENMEMVGEIEIDENCEGTLGNLPYGKYYVKERKAGYGYTSNDLVTEFTIDSNNLDISLILSNKAIYVNLNIIKRYGSKSDFENMTFKYEEGVSFEIYNLDQKLVDTITTDSSGNASIELPFGEYTIKQINSKDNYAYVQDRNILIGENSLNEYDLILDDYEIEVPNAGVYLTFFEFCYGVIDEYFSS